MTTHADPTSTPFKIVAREHDRAGSHRCDGECPCDIAGAFINIMIAAGDVNLGTSAAKAATRLSRSDQSAPVGMPHIRSDTSWGAARSQAWEVALHGPDCCVPGVRLPGDGGRHPRRGLHDRPISRRCRGRLHSGMRRHRSGERLHRRPPRLAGRAGRLYPRVSEQASGVGERRRPRLDCGVLCWEAASVNASQR